MFADFWVFACPLGDIVSWQSTIPLKLLCKQQSTIPSSDGLRIVVGCQKFKIISKNIIKHYFLYPTIDLDPQKSPIRVCQGGAGGRRDPPWHTRNQYLSGGCSGSRGNKIIGNRYNIDSGGVSDIFHTLIKNHTTGFSYNEHLAEPPTAGSKSGVNHNISLN